MDLAVILAFVVGVIVGAFTIALIFGRSAGQFVELSESFVDTARAQVQVSKDFAALSKVANGIVIRHQR